jgi:regulatory protein YycI of two-component signal transduction system YycFG
MQQPTVFTIILIILNVFLALAAFFGKSVLTNLQETAKETKEDIKRLFDKLDGYQKIKACEQAHEGHDKIHAMEQGNIDRRFEDMKKDINNIGSIARSKVSRICNE